jgi:hypothetical protein
MTDNIVKLEPKSGPVIPEFITASDIDSMTDDELDTLVAAIRTRRLASYHVYKQTKDEKDALERDKVQAKITKKCEQIIKDINAADKALEKMEQHIAELRGLRLQAGMALI